MNHYIEVIVTVRELNGSSSANIPDTIITSISNVRCWPTAAGF